MFFDPQCKPEAGPVKLEPWQQLLLDWAAVIEHRGHCKLTGQDDQGRVCPIRALTIAREFSADTVVNRATDALAKEIGRPYSQLIPWNDASERTAKQVIGALRSAAKVV